jgi:hypothetical protein
MQEQFILQYLWRYCSWLCHEQGDRLARLKGFRIFGRPMYHIRRRDLRTNLAGNPNRLVSASIDLRLFLSGRVTGRGGPLANDYGLS